MFPPVALSVCALFIYACSGGGGGCGPVAPAPPNVIQARYVGDFIGMPPHHLVDSLGDSIRVYAETIYFDTAAKTYTEASRVGRFKGFSAESIQLEHVSGVTYSYSDPNITLPTLISGRGSGSVYGPAYGSASVSISVSRGTIVVGYWYLQSR